MIKLVEHPRTKRPVLHNEDVHLRYEGSRHIMSLSLATGPMPTGPEVRAAEVASFCTVWYDDVACAATIEPVGTMPAHQQRAWARRSSA